ncbi:hypothetical protein ALC53_10340 [Atta colombica]|uniref:Uncharacterized protein n=1 Tax=Atta colombica TaxID=520822 RepID=A0A195B3W3_9HYME|nr:hypothetical protein ALC53_10340 [Atta colombica]
MDHEEKYGNPCYANVRILISSLNWTKERNKTEHNLAFYFKKCTIGVTINILLASSYCPSSVVTNLKYYVSKHRIYLSFLYRTSRCKLANFSYTIDFEVMATMIPVLRYRGTIEFLSPTCGPDEYCPIVMIGSSLQKNASHFVLSKKNMIGISHSLISLNYKLCDPCENVESIYAASMLDNDDIK